MKKLIAVALCSLTVCSISAQKVNVDAANKMAGKIEKVEEARALLNEAKENEETAKDPHTYFVAGKVEFDAYDKAVLKRATNPSDKNVNPLNMAEQLVNGYDNMLKVIELDTQDPKAKLSKDAVKKINSHYQDYYDGALTFYQEKKYYPEAYKAFLIYGVLPQKNFADKNVKATPDSISNQALYNAGVCAYSGNALKEAAEAFKLARLNNTENDQCYIYEIACWQNLAQRDSTLENTAKTEIDAIAVDGYKKFGMAQPVFFNNLVNSMVLNEKMDDALNLINNQIEKTPENANLFGLLGYVNDRKGDDEASEKNYRIAAEMPGVDAETLKNVSKKLYKLGTAKYNALDRADKNGKAAVKADYFEAAKKYAEKAKEISPETTSDMDYVIDNIDYALSTYFN